MKQLAILAALTGACTTTNSQDVTTHGIYADLGARADGTGTTDVYATLFFGDPLSLDFVRLTGNDQLEATFNGQNMVMAETELLGIVGHNATFTGDAAGSQFEIAFLRTVDAGAPSSTCQLPMPFTITTSPSTQSRAAPMTLTWSPSGTQDLMSWSASGDCINAASGTTSDTGTTTIAANTLQMRQGMGVASSCAVTLYLSRLHAGQLDPHYGKGGTINGEQRRTATFTTMP